MAIQSKKIEDKGLEPIATSDWTTASFCQIKEKRTKCISPYLESELWERDEILSIIKYEQYKRNKRLLSVFREVVVEEAECLYLLVCY